MCRALLTAVAVRAPTWEVAPPGAVHSKTPCAPSYASTARRIAPSAALCTAHSEVIGCPISGVSSTAEGLPHPESTMSCQPCFTADHGFIPGRIADRLTDVRDTRSAMRGNPAALHDGLPKPRDHARRSFRNAAEAPQPAITATASDISP